jgi:hypothetical protein
MGEETTKYAKRAKMGTQIVFKEESYKIIGAFFEVYKEKGNGFLEAVYQECLSIESSDRHTNQISFALRRSLLK